MRTGSSSWADGATKDGTCVFFLSGYCQKESNCPHKHYTEQEREESPPFDIPVKRTTWHKVIRKSALARLRKTECSICLENMKAPKLNPVGKIKKCGHTFHINCIEEWVKRRSVCPMCDCSI